MAGFLGIDTSNYTTSCAVYREGRIIQQKRLLPVPQGQIGLRQSDAVFSHVRRLGELMEELMAEDRGPLAAVGVSARPRDAEGSYMPCFLTGLMAARTAAAALRVPLYRFSHQAGHVAAALWGAGRTDLLRRRILAFHLSGGTTECLLVNDLPGGDISLLAATNDCNAGQIVDRVGAMLGLPFPAGPALEELALGSEKTFRVRPTLREGKPCLSGIENQCRSRIQAGEAPADVARFCLDSILAAVTAMAENAVRETGVSTVLFAGGVTSNTILRAALEKRFAGIFAPPVFSTDNAAGIALLASLRYEEQAPAPET